MLVSDIAVFVLKRDAKLQPTLIMYADLLKHFSTNSIDSFWRRLGATEATRMSGIVID